MTELRALALAPAARTWLAETTTARVLNVFDRACNLVNPRGQVLAVVTSERGLTPFALMVAASAPAPFSIVTAASMVSVIGDKLRIGSVECDFSAARSWDPTPDWPGLRLLLAKPGPVDALNEMAIGRGPLGSLLDLFAPLGPDSLLPSALRSRAQAGARDLVYGLCSGSVQQASAGAESLAGAGGGLTPAGDDFVLGAMLAAWAGLYGAGREELALTIAEHAATRTTTLSGAYLRAAARGECSAYWHDLFDALLRPDLAGLRPAVQALLAVGHTSGADALAGFLAARLTLPWLPAGAQATILKEAQNAHPD